MTSTGHSRSSRDSMAVKVPAITAVFWAAKLLTTGMGEAASDALASISPVVAVGVATLGIVVALVLQLRARSYSASKYWFAVAMVAVFATMAADAPHFFGLPLTAVSAAYAIALTAWFTFWWRTEGTLNVHTINTHQREYFYWGTVFLTFALGTALGDWSAFFLRLGFVGSILLFTVMIAVPALWYRFGGLNPVVGFWAAYVVTRPLGASLADWLGKPSPIGIGLGDGVVALTAAVVTTGLVAWLARTGYDNPDRVVAPPDADPDAKFAM